MALTATHLSVYFLMSFHWALLLRLLPKWINSVFEFIIRENMDFTNEITYSWESTPLKLDRMWPDFLWMFLSGLQLWTHCQPKHVPPPSLLFAFLFFSRKKEESLISFVSFIYVFYLITFYFSFKKKNHNQLLQSSTTLYFNVSVDASLLSLPAPWNVDMKHVSGLHPWIIFGLQPEGISVESLPFCFLLLRRFCTNIYQVTNYCTLCAQAYTNTLSVEKVLYVHSWKTVYCLQYVSG